MSSTLIRGGIRSPACGIGWTEQQVPDTITLQNILTRRQSSINANQRISIDDNLNPNTGRPARLKTKLQNASKQGEQLRKSSTWRAAADLSVVRRHTRQNPAPHTTIKYKNSHGMARSQRLASIKDSEAKAVPGICHDGAPTPGLMRETGRLVVFRDLLCPSASLDCTSKSKLSRNQNHFTQVSDSDGKTALHVAAAANNCSVLRWLLAKGAQPADISHNGTTALHTAAEAGHTAAMEILIQEGACVNKELEENWLKWKEEDVNHYQFKLTVGCFCLQYGTYEI